jgi:hypothetical protein
LKAFFKSWKIFPDGMMGDDRKALYARISVMPQRFPVLSYGPETPMWPDRELYNRGGIRVNK